MVDQRSSTPFLDEFAVNLNQKVLNDLDSHKAIGREKELERLIDILARSVKANPLILGEAGTGKTALVEALTTLLVKGKIAHPAIKDKQIYTLELAGLMGENFTQRLKGVVDEAINNSDQTILFIDEIHTIVGAGASGALDASNVLKPALARGEIQLIGATTFDEYHEFIEKDNALRRRFDLINLDEPDELTAFNIVKSSIGKYEKHHGVSYTDEAIKEAVTLSNRFIIDQKLPDKAFDIVDYAGSIAVSKGFDDIDEFVVKTAVSIKTNIPLELLDLSQETKVKELKTNLENGLFGQPLAIDQIHDAISLKVNGLADAGRPTSMMFLGTTGVGKTEAAKIIADTLYKERNINNRMIRFDMGEFGSAGSNDSFHFQLAEHVKVNPYSLVLFDEIEKPGDSGNTSIYDVLLQVLDDGRLTDSRGRDVDFSNTIIIFTTNSAAKLLQDHLDWGDFETKINQSNEVMKMVISELEMNFRPEFLNRIDNMILFNMLNDNPEALSKIVKLNLKKLQNKLVLKNVSFQYDQALVDFLIEYGVDSVNGARGIKRTVERFVTKPLSNYLEKVNFSDDYMPIIKINVVDDLVKFSQFRIYSTGIE